MFSYYRFSRYIVWLKVADTNSNPGVVASYFTDYIKEIQGVHLFITNA